MKEMLYQHCSNINSLSPKGIVLFGKRFFFLWSPQANVKEQLIPWGGSGIPVSHLQLPKDIFMMLLTKSHSFSRSIAQAIVKFQEFTKWSPYFETWISIA